MVRDRQQERSRDERNAGAKAVHVVEQVEAFVMPTIQNRVSMASPTSESVQPKPEAKKYQRRSDGNLGNQLRGRFQRQADRPEAQTRKSPDRSRGVATVGVRVDQGAECE